MDNFDDVVQRIKDANPIEDVAQDLGHKFERAAGKYWRVPHSGGLIINTVMQRFFWATKGWNGDVVELVMKEKGWEFKTAVEWLATRAHLEPPSWGRSDEAQLKAHRLKLSVFEVAQQLFAEWLWADPEALGYVRGRGFSEDLIRAAAMGFSGRKAAAQVRQMQDELKLYGIELQTPAAVAILGFEGDVREWGAAHNVQVEDETDWISRGRIPGMMNVPGIVYAHQWAGRTVYLSRRQLPGHDRIEGREWKSYNPPSKLVGVRQPYFNSAYTPEAADCVIVEGPADAESFGMWGVAAVALCGVNADDEGMLGLRSRLKRHRSVYLCLDDDETGRAKRDKVARSFGPMVRMMLLPAGVPVGSQPGDKAEQGAASGGSKRRPAGATGRKLAAPVAVKHLDAGTMQKVEA